MNKFNKLSKVVASSLIMSMLVGCGSVVDSIDQFTSGTMDFNGMVGMDAMEAECTTESCYDMAADYEIVEWSTEEYHTFTENTFVSVQDAPLSTFSADVDTASYANVRRMILDGYLPTTDAVRVEEFINYFSYDYKEPTGADPIAIQTELTDCPWNEDSKLLSIGISTEDVDTKELPPSNLVFLIDTSGSMSDTNKLPLVQKAFSLLVDQLKEGDRISIVTYAGSSEVLLSGATYDEKKNIIEEIDNLFASGSTNGSDAILTAYELAEKYYIENGNNRIILATDGDLNVGLTSESELKDLIEEKRESGIYLSALGFGDGNYKDNKMETLSQNGNGNYYYIDSKLEAQKVLVEEMGGTLYTVAKDVKLQVEFNPAFVEGYRLIGYENRELEAKDFTDDTKDAGEIGAGHTVTALYELIMVDSGQSLAYTELKYQEQIIGDSDELLTVSVRYKEPNGTTSKEIEEVVTPKEYAKEMSDNMMISSSVAEFCMLLRDSEAKGTASYESVLERIRNTSSFEEDDYIVELYTLVKKASSLG